VTTPKSQRIVMWIIIAAMTIGTIGGYAAIILQNGNDQQSLNDQLKQQEQQKQLQEQMARQQAASSKPLDGYSAETFDPKTVTDLQTMVLKEGEGDAMVSADSKIKLNYFGWTPDGKIFDSSNKNGVVTPLGNDGGIEANGFVTGFNKGLEGMKKGEVRKLMIPADQAYGSSGNPPLISPDTPIAFVVELVDIVK
jgi:FKBP-type peptidyl-prolyl cis-trans isomerase